MTENHDVATAVSALHDARILIEDQIEMFHRRIERLGIDGDALAFEEGRIHGARAAQIRIDTLLGDLQMRRGDA